MALRKDYNVTGSESYGHFIAELDEAITFRDHMEDHYALGSWLE
jgi:NADH dehydrogenase FAD-containing subunit